MTRLFCNKLKQGNTSHEVYKSLEKEKSHKSYKSLAVVKSQKAYQGLAVILAFSLLLTGCGKKEKQALVELPRDIYQKGDYQVELASVGDVTPTLTLELQPVEVETIDYSVGEADLIVEEIKVDVGDTVNEGDLIVSFKSDELKKKIEEYQNDLTEKQMLLEHYQNIYNMDTKEQSEKDAVVLQELKDDVALAQVYLTEAEAKLEKCQIKASRSGVITFISNGLYSGYVEAGQSVVTETCGNNQFTASTDDDYQFKVGDTFPVEYKGSKYEMKVLEIKQEEGKKRTISFEANEVILGISEYDKVDMVIQKPKLRDAIYISKDAICSKDDKEFVYVMDENGFLDAVYVKTGYEIDGKVAVLEGLTGSETVVIR